MHARAAGENCETRRSHSELVRAMPGQQTVRGAGQSPRWLHSSDAKLARVPKEAYLKSDPRNTLLVTAHRQSTFCSGTDAATHNARSVSDRGYCVRRTKPLPPRSHRHNNSAGLPHSAQTKRPLLRTTPPPRPW